MDKEEIEEKAKQLYFEQALMPIQLGVAIAEWMQEQTIEQARNAFCRYCQFDCEGHPHDDCTLLQEYIQTIKGER